jgi:two-component system CheB/CheR fusion protein
MAHAHQTALQLREDEVLSPVDVDRLLRSALELAGAQDLAGVSEIVRRAARELTRADGVTFVLREGPLVHYLDEDAIEPLWKGMRFPAEACISGWAMLNRRPAVIEDVFADDRIPHQVYRPTFVKSLAMVPVRPEDPVGAIGAYWAEHHRATPRELRHLTALAGFAAAALANAALVADLREAVAARDRFVGIASHELRTPLSALSLQVALAERAFRAEEGGRDGLRRVLDRVSRTARHLQHLVERLLDASLLGQHGVALRRAEVDLAAVAREAADALSGQTEIRVRADGPVTGRWDALRIEQVVQNLLANAVKFGSGRPVDVEVSQSGGAARLVVRDRGIGIAPEAKDRIFGRFERAVPVENYGGFGLGLWIVRQAVEAHGGRIAVDSAPGDGATFTVTLPQR